MMPMVIQDYIYGHVEKDVPYEELRDKAQAMVGNKLATAMGPSPMDIGEVNWQPAEANTEEGDYSVDAVWPGAQCHNCGGYGHFARDCPPKGLGKGGNKGFVKGGAKGSGTGGFKGNDKGAGKHASAAKALVKAEDEEDREALQTSCQGNCWKCGRAGHQAA